MLAVTRQLTKTAVRTMGICNYPEAWTKIATKELKGASPGMESNCLVICRDPLFQDPRRYSDEAHVHEIGFEGH